ncbi:MAG: hypothetical protein IT449_19265 [Phycisphaerales bacterium]|nr:hypothetical protein [Phycisphaerales bacterium]
MAEALLDAGVWWSLGAVRNHLRIAETLGILGQLSLPFAWLWFAGRANAFRYPLRMFIAVTLFGYAGDAAVGFISDGAECIMVGRLSYGYLSHRTIPMALLALALLLPACAVLKRPWAARRWLVILSTGIIGGSILPAVPAYYNGFIFDPFDVAAFELAPLLYLAQTIAAFVLVARERYRPDDAPACLTCGYNLTGNVSGVCPECGVRVRMEGAVGPGQAGQ